jgi:predicted dehydrogenase
MAEGIRIGLVGYKFMGKAHSNAYLNVGRFFDLPKPPIMKAICGRSKGAVRAVAERWGWESVETDYRKLIERDDIDLIDIATPNSTHAKIAIAAARAGKHVVCEKPLAMDTAEARKMLAAVRKARVKHMVWFNYRRVPAIALAKKLIKEGELGRIFHVRAIYLQDWIVDPKFPLVWRLRRSIAGSGAHGDLNAHIIDLARYLVGEFASVVGMSETFIKERPLEAEASGLSARGGKRKGKVTVDDAVLFLARFRNGTLGSFEATRFAIGRKNGERIEINGEKGSLAFNFERMDELELYSAKDAPDRQGFKTIMVTEPVHPYMSAYWPPGHIIGYEHTFVNQAADLLTGIARNRRLSPDFEDGLRCQQVLDAVLQSAKRRRWVTIPK